MKRYIVTGGAGFIGSNLVDKLLGLGNKVGVIDNFSTGKIRNLSNHLDNPNLEIYEKSITNNLEHIFREKKTNGIFHLAAQLDVRKSMKNPIFDVEQNIIGSLNVIEMAKKYNVKLIFSSTGGAVYGDTGLRPTKENHPEKPLSPYGLNKLYIDKYLMEIAQINYASLRYANVYGPRQNPDGEAGVVAIFLNKMLNNQNPTINGDGFQTRDYVYVDDVVNANVLAMDFLSKDIYNIGTGIETNVNKLFEILNGFFDNRFEERHAPSQSGEQKTSCLDSNKIMIAGWEPEISLKEGLRKTYEWFRKN